MKFKKNLQGKAKGDMPADALIQHLQHLARETVNINTSSFTESVSSSSNGGLKVNILMFSSRSQQSNFSRLLTIPAAKS